MRTTVTLDPDVEVLLRHAMRERDASFKEVLNEGLRSGLAPRAAKPPPPFRQRSFRMGRPLVDLTKATALAADLEDIELAERLRAGR